MGYMRELTRGDRLRHARVDAGMTQTELGMRLGLSRAAIADSEADHPPAKLERCLAWAVVTGAPLSWILGSDAA